MKYGDTLRQRSVPEWGHSNSETSSAVNIDYDYLKDLIKQQTTPGTSKALSIPGQGETAEKAFGDTFYKALNAQHDRISLFIRSKSGEIERRLEHMRRSLEQVQARKAPEGPSGRLPVRVVERYAKIDADMTKAGEEIRSLSRFQVAQRIGFHKILKTYKRWTKDTALERHFSDAVANNPDSFYQLDLGYLLDQYIDVLGPLRAPFDAPFWIPLLDKDIRKLPPPVRRQRRKATSATSSLSHDSSRQTSTSATSLTDGQTSAFTSRNGESSATSAPELVERSPLKAFRKKTKPYLEYPPPVQAQLVRQRYWNVYDNPESEDEGYYIYINPKASDKFPAQEFFEACVAKARKVFGIQEAPEEASGLSTAESSDYETADESTVAALRSYGTFASKARASQYEGYFSGLFRTLRDPHRDADALHTIRRETERERRSLLTEIQIRQHKAEMAKLYLYCACIAMAVILDVSLGMMTMTNCKKERGVVDTVVLSGTICNLLLCVIAVISMKMRREKLGWFHRSVVLLVTIGNVLVDVLLFTRVFNGP
ncbi:hypothetical protein DM02DRAFT_729576 [Periconia macrospinosa]|uniref:SPX domain-containing protein n=1 Tax=Periconia macrospinosa TaxID=97972 RepID=A0A2V1DL43_9PLEO|nr:hypothetical protein DM02DRAFT_729576 [Periconia macrospinosa]